MSTRVELDNSPILLAARVARAFGNAHRLAYAQITPELTIANVSTNFHAIISNPANADDPVEGRRLDDIFYEFGGTEDTLDMIMQGQLPFFRLEDVNRVRQDGETVYLMFQISPLSDAQPEAGLLLIVEDVTEPAIMRQSLTQERNELRLVRNRLKAANTDLGRLNRLKSFIVTMAAHDLRSPLTTIRSYADILADDLKGKVENDYIEFLMTIRSQSDRLSRLITDLLDLDMIEQGGLSLKPEPTDMRGVVQEAYDLMAPNALLHRLTLTNEFATDPVIVNGDGQRISQVLVNLISNAIKYTPEGGRVHVTLAEKDGHAVTTIIDTGNGMTEQQLHKLFQVYYRTEEARESDIVGSGLGLFIVKTLVEAHKGYIKVNSKRGEGTRFAVYIPLASESEAA